MCIYVYNIYDNNKMYSFGKSNEGLQTMTTICAGAALIQHPAPSGL